MIHAVKICVMLVSPSKMELVPDCQAVRVCDDYFISVTTRCQLAVVKGSDETSCIYIDGGRKQRVNVMMADCYVYSYYRCECKIFQIIERSYSLKKVVVDNILPIPCFIIILLQCMYMYVLTVLCNETYSLIAELHPDSTSQ